MSNQIKPAEVARLREWYLAVSFTQAGMAWQQSDHNLIDYLYSLFVIGNPPIHTRYLLKVPQAKYVLQLMHIQQYHL
jgi:hypothetical protein